MMKKKYYPDALEISYNNSELTIEWYHMRAQNTVEQNIYSTVQ